MNMVSGYSHNLCMFYCLRHALELHHSRLLCLTHTHKEDSTVFFPLAMLSSVVALLGQKNALCSSLLSHRHALLTVFSAVLKKQNVISMSALKPSF